MEVSFESIQMEITRMTEDFVSEDGSIYESCSICYESFTNKSFINECLHPFCYKCITDWTKVKAVCPLCIRPISRILHNIRSQDDYDVHEVVPPEHDVLSLENDFFYEDDSDGYTDTDSDYGAMESMDNESDFDMYDQYGEYREYNFDDDESNNDEFLEDNASEHPDDNASEHPDDNASEINLVTEIVDSPEEDETTGSIEGSENGDEPPEYYNATSDCEIDNENSYDSDSGDEDADAEDSETNYFDNFFEDAEDLDCDEQENDLETIDVSDDSYEEEHEEEEEFENSSGSDDEYYLSDRF